MVSVMEPEKDAQLVASAQEGDKIAFGVLVERYRRRVVAMAYAIVQDVHAAEDIAQTVFIKAYENLNRLREAESFGVWISKITYASAKDFIRKKRREKVTLEELKTQGYTDDAIADAIKTEDDLNRIIISIINEMSEQMQVVLIMRFFDRLPYADIADFLNTSRDTIRGMIYRGIKYIRQRLQPYLRAESEGGR